MTLLSIETSGKIFSALIWKDGKVYSKFHLNEAHAVSKHIATVVQNLLKDSNIELNEIDYALYNCGPGSFTGLRVGLSFLKGLFFNEKEKIVPIPSFDILNHKNEEKRIPIFESKRDEVYIFENDKIKTLKKTAFQENYNSKQNLISYSELLPSVHFEKNNLLIKEYDALHLVNVFVDTNFKNITNNDLELIYVYE